MIQLAKLLFTGEIINISRAFDFPFSSCAEDLMLLRSWFVCLTVWLVLTSSACGQEGYSYVAGHSSFSTSGDSSRGFVDGMIMSHDSRPVICYGAQKRPADKGRFTYIILFAPDAAKGGFSVDFSGKTDSGTGDLADVVAKFKLKQSEFEIAYAYTSDKKTGALTSEKLKINGEEIATNPPQVFLATRDGEKSKLTPVKAKVTTQPPPFAEDKTAYPFYLQQTIDALKKDSPEVAEFLKKK